jgi:membrane-associated protein
VSHLAERVLQVPPAVAVLLVFLLPALEASAFFGFLAPAEPVVVLGGVLAHEHKLPLWVVLVAAIAGAICGDSIGYEVGRRWGRRLLARIPERLLRRHYVERAEELIRRYGGRAVFLGRFTTTLRVLVPGFAGMSRVPYRSFLVWNALGGVLWATFFVLLGFVAGSEWKHVAHNATLVGVALVLVLGAAVSVHLLRLRRRRRDEPES